MSDEIKEQGTELIAPVISQDNAEQYYTTGGLTPFIEKVKGHVLGEVPDLTTVAGRKRIASLARQVSSSKVAVINPSKEYLRRIKALPKLVEAELREFTRTMDELRDEVRSPLTNWEQAEKERKQAHQERIDKLSNWFDPERDGGSEQAKVKLEELKNIATDDFEEFESKAVIAKELAIKKLTEYIPELEKREAEQAEIAQLRAKQEEHEREVWKARIAAEAEAKAKAEVEKAVQDQLAAAAKLEADHKRQLEQDKRNAEAAAELAARKAEEEKNKALLEARSKYEQEQREAREKEEAERKANEARALDNKHRATVNNKALFDLMLHTGIDEDQAKEVVRAIARGEIEHISITY